MQRMKTFLLTTVTTLWLALFIALPLTVHADGGDTTVIHACVLNKDGSMRIVSATTTCKGSETPLHWVNVARVSAIETKNTNQDSSISAAQSKNTAQDSSISAIQTKDTQQDGAISALQGQTGGGFKVVDGNSNILGSLFKFEPSLAGVAIVSNGVAVFIQADINGVGPSPVQFYYTSTDCSGPRLMPDARDLIRFGTAFEGNLVFLPEIRCKS